MGTFVYGAAPQADKILSITTTPYASGNTTAEIVLANLAISASQLSANDIMEVFASVQMNTSANNKSYKIYASVDAGTAGNNVPVGAVALGLSADFSSLAGASFSRLFPILSGSTARAYGDVGGKFADQYDTTSSAPATVTFNKFDEAFNIIISVTKSTGTDTATVDYAFVARKKS